jgi:hypothetical protein
MEGKKAAGEFSLTTRVLGPDAITPTPSEFGATPVR